MTPFRKLSALLVALALAGAVSACAAPNERTWIRARSVSGTAPPSGEAPQLVSEP